MPSFSCCFSTSKPTTFLKTHFFPDFKPRLNFKTFARITLIALTAIVLTGLAIYQGPMFLVGFLAGFTIQIVFPKQCSKAIEKIIHFIKKHPFFVLGLAVIATAALPEWLLIGPFIIGGFYAGAKAVEFIQKWYAFPT